MGCLCGTEEHIWYAATVSHPALYRKRALVRMSHTTKRKEERPGRMGTSAAGETLHLKIRKEPLKGKGVTVIHFSEGVL